MRRSLAVASLSGALLVGGAAGVLVGNPALSGAQAEDSTPATPDSTTPAPTAPDPGAARPWMSEALAPLVADGTITQAQADAVIAALGAAKPDGPFGGRGHGMIGAGLDAVASALGITTDEVRSALQDGTTLGELADQHGVSRDALVDALVAQVKERVDAAVADGSLTQAEADQRLERIRTELTEHLDDAIPFGMGGPGRRGPGDGSGRGWGSGDAPATPAAPSTSTTAA